MKPNYLFPTDLANLARYHAINNNGLAAIEYYERASRLSEGEAIKYYQDKADEIKVLMNT